MKYALAVTVALLISMPAHAEVFNGPRVGVQVGYESNSIDTEQIFVGSPLGTVTSSGKSRGMGTVGITLGYDDIIGDSFVVGGEIAGTFSTGSNDQVLRFSGSATPVNVDYKSNFTAEVTLRAGFLVGQKTLLYARGGYANSKLKSTIVATGSPTEIVKGNNNGFLVGGGVEHAISDAISARVEYKHFELKGPVTRDQVLVGVGYSF